LEKAKLTGGPGLSGGEREEEGGVAGWAWPKRKGRGRGGFGPKGRKGKREGGEIPFPFSNKFSMHFSIGFLIKLTVVFKTLIT